jgi:hypothetical protein
MVYHTPVLILCLIRWGVSPVAFADNYKIKKLAVKSRRKNAFNC